MKMSRVFATFYCLCEDSSCPYYDGGWCKLEKPEEECDDYATLLEESVYDEE